MAYNNNVKVSTAHLPYKDKKKAWITIVTITILVTLVIIFPEEIGSFIGKWAHEFAKGFRGLNE